MRARENGTKGAIRKGEERVSQGERKEKRYYSKEEVENSLWNEGNVEQEGEVISEDL